jgi:hypothetical protein
MKKKVFGFLSMGIVAVAMTFALSPSISYGQTGPDEGGNSMQEATQTKTVTTTYSWNATLNIWVIGGGGTRTKTETTTTTYKCCMAGGSTCSGIPC